MDIAPMKGNATDDDGFSYFEPLAIFSVKFCK